MQCPNCARALPDSGRFCPYCGHTLSIVRQDAASMPVAGQDDATRAAAVAGSRPAQAAFAFQEFGFVGAQTPGGLAPTSTGVSGPFLPLPASGPGMVPLTPLPGAVGSLPYGYPAFTAQPASLQVQQVPAARKRRGRSMGWIVFYAFMAIILLFTGLGVALHEIGAHVLGGLSAQYNARQAAAMQYYQQVMSQHPSVQDTLQDPSQTGWAQFQRTHESCAASSSGLQASIDDSAHFTYCLDQTIAYDNFAFQVQMHILNGDAGGLVFRVAYDENSLYMLQVASTGRYALLLDKDALAGKFSELASGTFSGINQLAGQQNTLMLIVRGSTFDIFINQQFVAEEQDATLANGRIGVMALDDNSPTQVVYSDAAIWQLSQ